MIGSMKIPLFPLDLVLFPGVPLPLHIFEPRYREMTAGCLVANSPFGIVRAHPEGLSVVGCTAQIVRQLHTYPDGRSDILTQGVDRFEIEQLIGQGEDTQSCLEAEVEILPDTGDPASRSMREECVALHFEALHLLGANDASMHFDLDRPIAYLIAVSAPADLDFRQQLLIERSDAARTESLVSYYREILPKLRRSREINRRASTNGHVN